jgi:hypothetical protein
VKVISAEKADIGARATAAAARAENRNRIMKCPLPLQKLNNSLSVYSLRLVVNTYGRRPC